MQARIRYTSCMHIPGIKLGPADWLEKLDAAHPEAVEIWYRVDQKPRYTEMIKELQHRQIQFGLHFWGVTKSGHEPNLAYPNLNHEESLALVKQCIEDAAEYGAVYVNIHSGNRAVMHINFDTGSLNQDSQFTVITSATAIQTRTAAL